MNQQDIISQLTTIRSTVDQLLEQLQKTTHSPAAKYLAAPKPNGLPKHVSGIIAKTPRPMCSKGQAGMLYGIHKAHEISETDYQKVLSDFGVSNASDLFADQIHDVKAALVLLAQVSNPHYPVVMYLPNGSDNPKWHEVNNAAINEGLEMMEG